MRFFFCSVLLSLYAATAHAGQATVFETWFITEAPTSDQIASWNRLPDDHNYRFHFADPIQSEIARLAELDTLYSIEVILDRYPDDGQLNGLQQLTQKNSNVQLVLMPVGYGSAWPTLGEVQALEALSLRELKIILPTFPAPEDGPLLSALSQKTQTSLVFATAAYPKFIDRDGLRSLPLELQLTFATDYWPAYAHMDVMNMIPHPVSLRVVDLFPGPDSVRMVQNITRLVGVTIQSSYEPSEPAFWQTLSAKPIQWIAVGFVPSAQALQLFAAGTGKKRLTIDQNQDLTSTERERLKVLTTQGVQVHWTREAPRS